MVSTPPRQLPINGSDVSFNRANDGYGGGIYSDNGVSLTNSTINKNFADFSGGGLYVEQRLRRVVQQHRQRQFVWRA